MATQESKQQRLIVLHGTGVTQRNNKKKEKKTSSEK